MRKTEIDWTRFQAGKYTGCTVQEVAEKDRPYLLWMVQHCANVAVYAPTLEQARPLVAEELSRIAQDREAWAKAAREAQVEEFGVAWLQRNAKDSPGYFVGDVSGQLLREGAQPLDGKALQALRLIWAKEHGGRQGLDKLDTLL